MTHRIVITDWKDREWTFYLAMADRSKLDAYLAELLDNGKIQEFHYSYPDNVASSLSELKQLLALHFNEVL